MGVARASDVQKELLATGWPEGCSVEMISKAQTPGLRVLRCHLAGLAAVCAGQEDLNPAILLIRWRARGGMAGMRVVRRPGLTAPVQRKAAAVVSVTKP